MEHLGYVEGRQFQDRMRSGPMSYWLHTHSMTPEGNGSLREDRIQYKPPLGALGNFVAGGLVRNKLARLFRYRYAKLAGD